MTVARLAAPSDNVAIAVRQLEAGTQVRHKNTVWTLQHTVLEGHRIAVRPIAVGEKLVSWGLPFGIAIAPLAPGDYICNRSMLEALKIRALGIALPTQPNFEDEIVPFQLDEKAFRPGEPAPPAPTPRTFQGYRRPGGRGVGTRNFVVILGTTSRTAGLARQLAARLQPLAKIHPGIDGIVAIAHTEGGGPEMPNNSLELLKTLAGFMVHPNVGAVLALDHGFEPVNNARLQAFMREGGYPLEAVPHRFLTARGAIATELAEGERIVRGWLAEANACRRTAEPVSGLRVALQCGGSDAFSGVSGNPLAGAMVHEVVRHGGAANLCETDEMIGAEAYILRNMRDLATAQALRDRITGFKERLSWHGATAEANPSAGNKLRGLYNIVLKSLGAVHKKDPRTRVEAVIDYADPMRIPGFHFMNSPGNDLEGIAGQVAAGCNLVLFVTGNGSITNFPFVPTLKVTTTTRRHQLLQHEMDINAGRYLDGETMEALTAESFDLLLDTASGRQTKGEHAGHSQVSIWRNWRQTAPSHLATIRSRPVPDGVPVLTQKDAAGTDRRAAAALETAFPVYALEGGRWATERIALVLPTSLCATQIARLAAERLTASGLGREQGISRFVALVHTEGCGFGGEGTRERLQNAYRGYATHPNVAAALLLEHGCEKVPNDAMRRQFEASDIPLARFGWASVQLDGGIDRVLQKVEAWFQENFSALRAPAEIPANLGALTIGLQTCIPYTDATAGILATFARGVVAAGGTVLIAESDPLLANTAHRRLLLGEGALRASLVAGQVADRPGLHVVETETSDWSENLASLGACGAHLFVTLVSEHAREGHPLLPVLQFVEGAQRAGIAPEDVDGFLSGKAEADLALLAQRVAAMAQREYVPAMTKTGLNHFQLTRGLLGVST